MLPELMSKATNAIAVIKKTAHELVTPPTTAATSKRPKTWAEFSLCLAVLRKYLLLSEIKH
jgi:hypothetical protein